MGFVQEFPRGLPNQIVQGGNNAQVDKTAALYCQSIAKKAKILILDDSTSAVDTKTDALIRKAFRGEIPNTTKLSLPSEFLP